MTHDFELTVPSVKELTPEVADAFYEAGCDDATLSLRDGMLHVAFAREAETEEVARESARHHVSSAIYRLTGGVFE